MNKSDDKYIDLLKSALCASLYDESAWSRVEGPWYPFEGPMKFPKEIVAMVKRAVVRFLRARNLALVRTRPFDPKVRDAGEDWPLFGFTMTGRRRLDSLQSCIENIFDNNVPGDFAETGGWRGGSVILMRALLRVHNSTDRIVWCADSFEGMPVPAEADKRITKIADWGDLSDREYLKVSVEQVRKNFERFGLLDEQVKFIKGWFGDTLPTAPIKQLALLRLDGDLYKSTRDALVNLYDKVSQGGYVIVDDYNSWITCRAAVDEFRKQRGISEKIMPIDAQSILWKVGADNS